MVSPPVSPATLLALGVELREKRNKAGLTQVELANRIGVSKSVLARLEDGERLPSNVDLAFALRVLGVRGNEFDQIMALAGEVHQPNLVATDAPRLPQLMYALMDYERRAAAITGVHLTLMPGLLQTPDYAHAVFANAAYADEELESHVAARLKRQKILDGDLEYAAIIDEPVLRRAFCGRRVAIGQLQHLLTMGERDNISIQVIPYDHDAVTQFTTGCELFEFTRIRSVVYLEHPMGADFIDQANAVRKLRERLDRLRESVLSEADSASLIDRAIKNLETQ